MLRQALHAKGGLFSRARGLASFPSVREHVGIRLAGQRRAFHVFHRELHSLSMSEQRETLTFVQDYALMTMMVEASMAQRQEAPGALMVRPRTAATFMTYLRHQPLVLGA
ncbi:hypothetical protein V497_04171 [Pseudogymnoascus sp. VKM F-4516 (FW-969)]|nr:hypothetical protein V497_04171 [Pseudogymnoascus sp. VKM F-4516 (FW-969)]